MKFCVENLSVLAYSKGFTLWLYKTTSESGTACADPMFFSQAGDVLSTGDMVMVSSRDGGRLLSVLVEENGARTMPTL